MNIFIKRIESELEKIKVLDKKRLDRIKKLLVKEKSKYSLEKELSPFSQIEKKIELRVKELELIKKRKSIIIDTNILIEEPNIIGLIGGLQDIVFSVKVLDELDKLKNRRETKRKAQEAIRNIRKNQKMKNVYFETASLDKLPKDLDPTSPDNMILSVAMEYENRNPVLLTNDKGLQLKSVALGIPAKSNTELKRLLTIK